MRKICFIILLISISLGCATKDNIFDKIEFATWDIRRYKNDHELDLHCKYYALIDKNKECQIVVKRYYQTSNLEYLKIDESLPIFKKTVSDIAISSLSIGSEADFRPESPSLYNGKNLIMQIKKGNTKKVINFWQDEQESKIYERLYILIDSLYMTNVLIKTSDTLNLYLKRKEFINNIIKPDSLVGRLPPPAPRLLTDSK